jgi:hypothetical protein
MRNCDLLILHAPRQLALLAILVQAQTRWHRSDKLRWLFGVIALR